MAWVGIDELESKRYGVIIAGCFRASMPQHKAPGRPGNRTGATAAAGLGWRSARRRQFISQSWEHRTPLQQPEAGETPGVAAAPVALAGAIMGGLARSIEMFSLQAAVFGVGIMLMPGLMLVSVLSSPAVGD